MTLSTKIDVRLGADLVTALDLGGASAPLDLRKVITMATGTGTGLADQIWHDDRQIAASGTDDLDLSGALTNALGASVAFARIKALLVLAADANTNNVLVGGAASAQFINWVSDATDKVVVAPGGLLLLVAPKAGYVVTATTGDLLRIANSAGGTVVNYKIALIGATA